MPLTLHTHRAHPSADLSELFGQPGEDAVQHVVSTQSGDTWLTEAHTWRDGETVRRRLVRHRRDGPCWETLDTTGFQWTATHFTEASRHRSTTGENLHPQPIRLPRVLRVGQWHRPVPEGRVCLAWAGSATLSLGGLHHRTVVAGLLAVAGGERRIQWLARGLGEVALGPARGPLRWWITGARVGEDSVLQGVSDELLALERTPLPVRDPPGASAGLL